MNISERLNLWLRLTGINPLKEKRKCATKQEEQLLQ